MPNRILREGIVESRAVNSLSKNGELFYRRLMSIVDDFGRYEADPKILRPKLFGLQLDKWSDSEVTKSLEECNTVLNADGEPLVAVYEVGAKSYLQVNKFCQRTRTESRYPAPGSEPSKPRVGSVYFIRSDKGIKIGYTEIDPKSRLASLQVGSSEKLELLGSFAASTPIEEREAHKALAAHRIRGEWFADCLEVRLYLKRQCAQMRANARNGEHMRESAARASNTTTYTAPPSPSSSPTQTQNPLRAREAEKPELGEVLELAPVEAEVFDESFELWERFWKAYVATGKPLTIQDRIASENVWKGYPLEEQRRILPHLGTQIRDNWSGPKYTPKPQRYLSAREWEAVAAERVFPTPTAKESTTDQAMRMLVQRMREKGVDLR